MAKQKSRSLVAGHKAGGEQALVDDAIAHITSIYHRGAIATVVEVGDYLIEKFFAGDLELAVSRNPDKPTALARLLVRANETPLSVHSLKTSIRIAAQYHRLPQPAADQLPQSHHELLLLIEDTEEKNRLAVDAAARSLTRRQLEKKIRAIRRRHAGGRRAKPPLVRWAKSVQRTTAAAAPAEHLTAAALRALSPEDVTLVQHAVRQAREQLERVSDALSRHLR